MGKRRKKLFATGFLALLIVGAVMMAGCSKGEIEANPAADKINLSDTETSAVTIYFSGELKPDGLMEMVPVRRNVPGLLDDSRQQLEAAILALLQGPTAEERAQGLTTQIPQGVSLIVAETNRPLAKLDFTSQLEKTGGTMAVSGLLKQIAYTASAIEGIKGVELFVEGERVGSQEHPFTGEGVLFRILHRPLEETWLGTLSPTGVMDLFIAVIPDSNAMWSLMGSTTRGKIGLPHNIETSAFAEGLGSWRNYAVQENIQGDNAQVILSGDQVLEGTTEPGATYRAIMVHEEGIWKWDNL